MNLHRDISSDPVILCLCEANYVRSVLAEGILRRIVIARDDHIRIKSAGTSTWGEGRILPPTTLALLKEMGCPIPLNKRPHRVTTDELEEAAVILCMDRGQMNWLREKGPAILSRALFVSVLTGRLEELPNASHEDITAVRHAAAWLEWHLIQGYPALMELIYKP